MWLKPLDLALIFGKLEYTAGSGVALTHRPITPGIKHVMQFLLLCSSFADSRNTWDEILLTCKRGYFASTLNAGEIPIWFEAEISRYFLSCQGMPPEAHFHWPQALRSWFHFQRRTERKAPKAEEQVLDFSWQCGAFYNACATSPKLTEAGPWQVSRCNCSTKETVWPSDFFRGKAEK